MHWRRAKKTRLIYCEGAHDKAFLDCLKFIYVNDRYNVDIKRGAGGDQVHLVEEAIRKSQAYEGKYIKIDGDRNLDEMAKAVQLAGDNGLVVLKTVPCLERLLINILEPTKRIASWPPDRLKRYFEANYIPADKRTNVRAYKAIFTKAILDGAKNRLEELDEIIKVFS